jgi:hypothetical protein
MIYSFALLFFDLMRLKAFREIKWHVLWVYEIDVFWTPMILIVLFSSCFMYVSFIIGLLLYGNIIIIICMLCCAYIFW